MTDHQAAQYLHRLYEVATAAAAAATPEQVVGVVLGGAIAVLEAAAGVVVRLDAGERTVSLVGAAGAAVPVVDAWRRRPRDALAAPGPLTEVVRTGSPIWPPAGAPGLAVFPLWRGGRPDGALALAFPVAPEPRPAARDFLATLAQVCALALERIDQADRIDEAIRSRDDFLAVASHELRTPITSLHGFAQLLLRQLRRHGHVEPERLVPALVRIEEQSGRLARLVGQLLDVTRMDGGDLRLDRQPVDLARLVRRTVATVQAAAGRHRIVVDAPDTLEASVDPARFEHVLVGLLSNAVSASPEGGRVEVELTWPGGEAPLRLTVTDDGPTPSPERRDRLFDRYAAEGQEGASVAWMGLWLDVSRRIVELHGGTMGAEFPAGGGTRLTVSLPPQVPSGT